MVSKYALDRHLNIYGSVVHKYDEGADWFINMVWMNSMKSHVSVACGCGTCGYLVYATFYCVDITPIIRHYGYDKCHRSSQPNPY